MKAPLTSLLIDPLYVRLPTVMRAKWALDLWLHTVAGCRNPTRVGPVPLPGLEVNLFEITQGMVVTRR